MRECTVLTVFAAGGVYPQRWLHWYFMPFEEVVEAEGHLIDSHVMEQIFDKVVESNGRFEVEQFRIGRTNGEPSYLRLRVQTPTRPEMDHVLAQLLAIGCSPAC